MKFTPVVFYMRQALVMSTLKHGDIIVYLTNR